MKINQLKIGVVLSYVTQGVHLLISILYTPVMLRLLGQSEYGLFQLVSSVVAYLGLLNFGFSSGYIRFYSRYKSKEDYENIATLNGMFLIIFTFISIVCLLCGGIMIANAKAIFGDGLTNVELNKSKILMFIMILNMAISFIGNVFSCNIIAHEKFFFQKIIGLLSTVLNPFITLPILLMGYGSIGMVVISTLLSGVSIVASIWYCLKKLNIRFSFKKFDFSLFIEMFGFTFFIFINMIVDQINWSVDKFLIGRMLGTKQVSIYSIGAQLNNLYLTFSASISAVFIPKVNLLIENKVDSDALTKLFTKVGRIQFLIIVLILTGYILFGEVFINLWVGQEYAESYMVGILLMVPVTIPLIQNLGIEIQRAKNMHQFRSYVYIAMAVSNLLISVLLIKHFGVFGAAIGTTISLFIGNGLIMNVYYHKRIGLDIKVFWKEIFKFFPPVMIAVILGYVIKSFILTESILSFAFSICIYCAVYCLIMWRFGMNESEKGLISKPLERIGIKLWS